ELDRDGLGALARGHHAHAHRLAGRQIRQPEIAQHRDVQEHVLAAGIGRHEAVALERAEPLDDAVDFLGIGDVRSAGPRTASRAAAAHGAARSGTGARRAVGLGVDLDYPYDLTALRALADLDQHARAFAYGIETCLL